MPILEITSGKQTGERIALSTEQRETVIGRHPMCDVVLAEGAVSRKHVRITYQGDEFFVEDLGSLNGTQINGVSIEGRQALVDQDRIQVQHVTMRYHESDSKMNSSTGYFDTRSDETANGESPSDILASVDVGSGIRHRKQSNAENVLKAFQEIILSVGNAMATTEVIQRVFESVFRIFPQANCGHALIREIKGKRLVNHTYVRGRKGEKPDAAVNRSVSATIVKKVMNEGVAILSADAANDERFSASESITSLRIRSVLCAPLMDSNGKAMGAIQVESTASGQLFDQDDLDLLASIASLVANAVERSRVHQELLELEFQHQELETAREVQREFLPQGSPEVKGYHFFAFYEPAYHVGGDYYDYVTFPDGRLAMALGDVSGKGIGAALFTARLCSEVRFSLSNHKKLSNAVSALNRSMFGDNFKGRFVTFVVGLLDPKSHQLTIVNAGHMPPLLCRGGDVIPIGEGKNGPPLAFDTSWKYEEVTVKLEPGDTVVAYTDGISEATNHAKKMLNNDGVRKILAGYPDDADIPIGQHLMNAVSEFVGEMDQQDDTCMVSFGREK